MSLYSDLASVAVELITEFGGDAILTQAQPVDGSNPQPWKPSPVADGPVYTFRACILPLDSSSARLLQALTGTDVPEAHAYALVAGPDLPDTPTITDAFQMNGENWRIVAADTYRPDGATNVLHIVFLRK